MQNSSHTVRVQHLIAMADKVFGNPEKALLWLRSPNERLSNLKPLDVLNTESGGQMVESMLWQIDEGIYS
jgi:putative toxin-antitoxin system antitoxin component (TIGR02293 family)